MSYFAGSYYLHPEPRIYNPSLGDLFFDISGTFEDTVHDDVPVSCFVAGDNCCFGCGSGCGCGYCLYFRVIVIGVPLVIFPFPFITSLFLAALLDLIARTSARALLFAFMQGHSSELVHGSDCYNASISSPFKSQCPEALAPSFRCRLWAVFCRHHSFHVAPGDLIALASPKVLNISFPSLKTGVHDEQAEEEVQHLPDWFQQPTRLPSPDHAWNKSVPVVHESV
ncbi:hypothetical protein Tco_0938424 [Tanacetum coccineum]|uniref:Uncharacterized protein n=1 Tax=Tanacetum coccineum TaxID=301880 RepID=A0ABQ5DP46_9ASTR